MNLEELVKQGSVQDGYEQVPVEWTNDEGEQVAFDIYVKREMSAADYEYIYLGSGRRIDPENGQFIDDGSDSFMARRVHRLVRVGDGTEVIPEGTARKFKHTLLMAMASAITKVERPVSVPSKKNSRKKMNSGTS